MGGLVLLRDQFGCPKVSHPSIPFPEFSAYLYSQPIPNLFNFLSSESVLAQFQGRSQSLGPEMVVLALL